MNIESACAPPFLKNGFVVSCERTRQAIYIDPGDEVDELLGSIARARLDVTAILLTHAHVDHVSGVAAAKRALAAPIWLHPDDTWLYQHAVQQGALFGYQLEPPPPVDRYYDGRGPLAFGDYDVFAMGPITRDLSTELMKQADLVVVTGSQNNVRAGYSSGTPALGVGTGNVAVIVDESADCADAAAKIMRSKIFDNATSCSSENSVIIHDKVYDRMLAALVSEGGALLSAAEKETLQKGLFPGGKLSPACTAQSVSKICAIAGLTRAELVKARCLMVEETGTGKNFPYSGEKLSPVLTVYRARDFDHAFSIMRGIYDYLGDGHSCGVYTENEAHIERLAREMTVCRVIVKQAHTFANGGSFDNGLPFSLSMGCGTWGGNSFSENLNYKHFMNVTRVVRPIPEKVPAQEDIFGAYWQKHGK